MTLQVDVLDNELIRVCLTEDGIRDLYVTGVQTCALPIFTEDNITSCTVVSSMHLVEEKAKQLRAANAREAAAAYDPS